MRFHGARILGGIVLAAVLLGGPRQAEALLVWDWFYLEHEFLTFPTSGLNKPADETVVLHARLFNSLLSNEPLTQSYITGAVYSSLDSEFGGTTGIYDFDFGPSGPASYFTQFAGLDLAPGDGGNFVFGTLTPSPVPAPDGSYIGHGRFLLTNAQGGVEDRQHSLTVNAFGSPQPSPSAPEPSSLLLLSTGLLAFIGTGSRRRV